MADTAAAEPQTTGTEIASPRMDRTPPSLSANPTPNQHSSQDQQQPKNLYIVSYRRGYERALFLHTSGRHMGPQARYHKFHRASREIKILPDATASEAIFSETLGPLSSAHTSRLHRDCNSHFVEGQKTDAWIDRVVTDLRSSTAHAYRHITD